MKSLKRKKSVIENEVLKRHFTEIKKLQKRKNPRKKNQKMKQLKIGNAGSNEKYIKKFQKSLYEMISQIM